MTDIKNSNDDPKTLRDDLLESFQVNVIGLVNTVSAFIGLVQQGTAKKVIAISSGMADTDMVNEVFLDIAAPYAISKAGVNMVMAKYNALYSKEGVLFMAICPGSVATSAQNPSTSGEFQTPNRGLVLANNLHRWTWCPGL